MTEQIDKDDLGRSVGIFMLCIMVTTVIAAVSLWGMESEGYMEGIIVLPYMGISIVTVFYQGLSAWLMLKNKSAYICIICGIIFLFICGACLVILIQEKLTSQYRGHYFFLTFIQMVTLAIGIWYSIKRKDL